jgi:hypothetical protein
MTKKVSKIEQTRTNTWLLGSIVMNKLKFRKKNVYRVINTSLFFHLDLFYIQKRRQKEQTKTTEPAAIIGRFSKTSIC